MCSYFAMFFLVMSDCITMSVVSQRQISILHNLMNTALSLLLLLEDDLFVRVLEIQLGLDVCCEQELSFKGSLHARWICT